jgi:hypothetical protein
VTHKREKSNKKNPHLPL